MVIIDNMEKRTIQILQYINKNEGCQVQDVTEHLGLSRPLTSAILKSMEELGLIKSDFGEGRAVILKITEHEINELVYQIYGITQSEIKIVEANL